MKLDKMQFGMLVAHCVANGMSQGEYEIKTLDTLCEIGVPEQATIEIYPKNENVERLMALMAEGTKKIDAIREHRAITGMGLKESKDTVERYWNVKYTKEELRKHWEKQPMQQLDSDIILKFIESL